MRITPENTLAIAVDFQERLVPAMSGKDELIRNSSILLKGLAVLGVPVILTRQYPKGLGETVAEIKEAAPGQPEYDKLTFSCYDDEGIREAIRSSGRNQIILCGIEAHICVLQTALGLKEDGFDVLLVENCTGSRKQADKDAALRRSMTEGILPATYESVLFELTQIAGTPQFKEISRLIK